MPSVAYVPNNPVCYVPSLASTTTVNSVLSNPESGVSTPPLPGVLGGVGSVLGIGPRPKSPPLHQKHPVSNDLYAVVSKPGLSSYNNIMSTPAPPSYRTVVSPLSNTSLPERNSSSPGSSHFNNGQTNQSTVQATQYSGQNNHNTGQMAQFGGQNNHSPGQVRPGQNSQYILDNSKQPNTSDTGTHV